MTIPYTKNPTWVDGSGGGTPINAARLNTIEDGIYTAHYQPCAHVYRNTAFSLTSGVGAAITFNNELLDQAGNASDTQHDNVTNSSRLTCRYAGFYLITGGGDFAASASGIRTLAILKQGATNYGAITVNAASTGTTALETFAMIPMQVNEYVELVASQNSGGSLNFTSGTHTAPWLAWARLG